jgi:hypothetical protein
LPSRRLTAAKCLVLERIWAPLAAWHLRRTIQTVKPDVVFIVMYNWPIIVAAKTRFPNGTRLHVSLLDYPDTQAFKRIWGILLAQRFVDSVYSLVRRAHSWDGITPAMVEEISANTGRSDGLVVHPGFEAHQIRALETRQETPPEELVRIAYVGTVISKQEFLEMVAALERLRPTLKRRLVWEFFGGRGYRNEPWFNPEWMIEREILPTDQDLIEALQRCAWGVVVMDPGGRDPRYSRFSFPGKVGAYLAAGVPLLGLGHVASSLADLMRRHPVGRFSTAARREELAGFLRESLDLPHPRQVFREAVLHCAREEFNADWIRRRLWRTWGVNGSL